MQIIGHRGAAGLAPENSLEAIAKAIICKADWVEIDIRRTADGVLVAAHDRHMDRATATPPRIDRTTYAQLAAEFAIMTLDEALSAVAGKIKINIELKTSGCALALAHALTKARAHGLAADDVLISSFWPHILREFHTEAPEYRLGLLTHINIWSFTVPHRIPLAAVGFYWPFALRPIVQLARRRGLFTYAYTVNRPVSFARITARGLDAVVTDYPARFTQQG